MASIKRPTQNKWMSGIITLSADQTANLTAGNHIEFDTAYGDFAVSTGAGQADGLITLPGGHRYRVMAVHRLDASDNSGSLYTGIYDTTNAAFIAASQSGRALGQSTGQASAAQSSSQMPVAIAEFYVETTVQIEIQITFKAANTDTIIAAFTSCIIEEIPK